MTKEEKANIRAKEWYQVNKERKKAYDIAYNAANRAKKNAQSRNWVKNNPEKRTYIIKKSYINTKPQKMQYAKEYGARLEVKKRVAERATARSKVPENKHKALVSRLWSRFRIVLEQRNEALLFQSNLCGICNKPETAIHNLTGKVKLLCIDHNHDTLENRGLLCMHCNSMIGFIERSFELFDVLPTKIKNYLFAETEFHRAIRSILKRQD